MEACPEGEKRVVERPQPATARGFHNQSVLEIVLGLHTEPAVLLVQKYIQMGLWHQPGWVEQSRYKASSSLLDQKVPFYLDASPGVLFSRLHLVDSLAVVDVDHRPSFLQLPFLRPWLPWLPQVDILLFHDRCSLLSSQEKTHRVPDSPVVVEGLEVRTLLLVEDKRPVADTCPCLESHSLCSPEVARSPHGKNRLAYALHQISSEASLHQQKLVSGFRIDRAVPRKAADCSIGQREEGRRYRRYHL